MQNVAASLSDMKRGTLPTTDAMIGLDSVAPKWRVPITVVMQSIVPIATNMKAGQNTGLNRIHEPSPSSSLAFSNLNSQFLLMNYISRFDILHKK